jgi:hypothetical protein
VRAALAIVVGALLGAACSGPDGAAASAGADPRVAALQGEVGALIEAIAAGDDDDAHQRASGLALPDAERWFAATFGPAGGAVAAEYAPLAAELPQMTEALRPLAGRRPVITVERFADATDTGATGYQAAALSAMARPVPLYSVRLTLPADDAGPEVAYHVWSFVDVDGRFRWVGKLRPLVGTPPGDGADPLEVRVRDRVAPP